MISKLIFNGYDNKVLLSIVIFFIYRMDWLCVFLFLEEKSFFKNKVWVGDWRVKMEEYDLKIYI